MRIDTHCHLDLLEDPISVIEYYRKASIRCIMASLLPSHYHLSIPHLANNTMIQPALGLHPLRICKNRKEVLEFIRIAPSVDYIGEIGLDLSYEGMKTKLIQISILKEILPLLRINKFVSIHCRNAHRIIDELFEQYGISPVCFHYYTGSYSTAEILAKKGHYFSINSRMLKSKHRILINIIPKTQIIVESDAPFLTKDPITEVDYVYQELSRIWGISIGDTENLIYQNFMKCRTR